MQPTFPLPEADALAHSDQLAAALRAEILAQGGAMPFSRFMELCLYTPGWGYYSAGASKFGGSGDFSSDGPCSIHQCPEITQVSQRI